VFWQGVQVPVFEFLKTYWETAAVILLLGVPAYRFFTDLGFTKRIGDWLVSKKEKPPPALPTVDQEPTDRAAFETYKTFVLEFPTSDRKPTIPTDDWSIEKRRMLRIGLCLKNLERVTGTNIQTAPASYKGVHGYRRIGDRFHFGTWLAEDRHQREIDRDSPTPQSPVFPSREELEWAEFQKQIEAFRKDPPTRLNEDWPPEYRQRCQEAVTLGYFSEEHIQAPA
jgi:hypothetical protein